MFFSACHSSIRRAKILIRGHPHHLRHRRAINTSFCKEENIVFRPIKHRFLKPYDTKIQHRYSGCQVFRQLFSGLRSFFKRTSFVNHFYQTRKSAFIFPIGQSVSRSINFSVGTLLFKNTNIKLIIYIYIYNKIYF